MSDIAKCELCGEPMPEGEIMFKFHLWPCPKPPLPKKRPAWIDAAAKGCAELIRDSKLTAVFSQIIEHHFSGGGA